MPLTNCSPKFAPIKKLINKGRSYYIMIKSSSSLKTILFDWRWPLFVNHKEEHALKEDDKKYPIRKGWMITYGVILFSLLTVELYTVFTKDWSATLTNQFLALVERYPFLIGVPAVIFLTWLWWHFVLPIIAIWFGWHKRENKS